METGSFLNAELVDYFENHFVPLKYKSGADAEQFHRFGVDVVPVFIVLDSDGNEVYRNKGYVEADLLIQQLERARKKAAYML